MTPEENKAFIIESGVPSAVTLCSTTFSTEFQAELANMTGACGLAEFDDARISLQPSVAGYHVSPDRIQAHYWHEVVHIMLDIMGRKDLRDDEGFVTAMGNLLHQVIKTANYPEQNK